MTTTALSVGCALIAFSPTLALLFILAYRKAQLIIVVTTSAFAFLLSSLLASLLWLPVPSSQRENALLLVIPSVLCQVALRCGFVWLYHKVERVIEKSIRRHERHEQADAAAHAATDTPNGDGAGALTPSGLSESARLRLELNDWSCGIAAGTGFGLMHAIFLYGTLLASESGGKGTLYQPSCSAMPSLVNSATMAFMFSILDVVWMLMTFYGMRRRRSEVLRSATYPIHRGGLARWGSFIGDDHRGGTSALAGTVVSHLAAGFSTTPNREDDGCLVALPLLSAVVVTTVLFFVCGVSRHFLPESQRRRIGQRGRTDAGGGACVDRPYSYHED